MQIFPSLLSSSCPGKITEMVLSKNIKKIALRTYSFFAKNSKKLFFIAPVISVLLLAGLIFNFKEYFVVALVNNKPITRMALDRELEKQAGSSALENMVMKTLIEQEAKKKNVNVTQGDIDQKIQEIEKQLSGQSLDTILASRGQTRNDLTSQIKIQIIVEKLLAEQVNISDEEITKYFTDNKTSFPKGATLERTREEIKETLYQQKMSEVFGSWSEKLKNEAKITYFLKL